ncbi:hypothetical protein FQN57_002834 [Myotisia sp. PD_48]|nr:hypothetical protein FQN57_002834 [Myotisia sp. PD_48]
MASSSNKVRPFGHSRLDEFPLDPKYKNLNHGSFGTFPKSVLDKFRSYQDEYEGSPDTFLRYKHPPLLRESREQVAKIINAPTESVVYVKNATTGVCTILTNLEYQPGDIIIYFSGVYGAVEKTLTYLAETTPLRARKVEYTFPISHAEIVQKFEELVRKVREEEKLNVKLAVFDIVSSQPGVRAPFEKLVQVCKREGILSCIDGAHGIGHVPLDMSALDPDFFVSNCHKWLYTPRGCSVFYVPVRNQHLIRTTLPTSHGFVPIPGILSSDPNSTTKPTASSGKVTNVLPTSGFPQSAFELLFEFVATNDDLPYLCVPMAIKYRQEACGGEAAIMKYCEDLAWEAGNAAAAILGTEVIDESKGEKGSSQLRQCAFANVRLPLTIVSEGEDKDPENTSGYPVVQASATERVCRWIEKELTYSHNTLVPTFVHNGHFWVRLSAQIYLDLDDFKWVAGVLKGICERVAVDEGLAEYLKRL